jgi:hypothetical protein
MKKRMKEMMERVTKSFGSLWWGDEGDEWEITEKDDEGDDGEGDEEVLCPQAASITDGNLQML